MTIAYIRSAYTLAAGIGYMQTHPGSPADLAIEGTNGIRELESKGIIIDEKFSSSLLTEGLYPELHYPPGWSIIAAGLHRLIGEPIWLIMQILGIIVDSIACILLFMLVRLLFPAHIQLAWIATILYAVFPPLAYSAVSIRPESFMNLFLIVITFFFIKSALAEQESGKWRYYILTGLSIGMAGYFRPDFLLLGPFFTLYFLFTSGLAIKTILKMFSVGLVILIVSLLILFPWGYRNHKVFHTWNFTSSALGCTLVTGLGTYPNPWGFGPSDLDRAKEAEQAGISTPFNLEADKYFKQVFFQSIQQHPEAYLKILISRCFQPLATPYDCGVNLASKTKTYTEIRSAGNLINSIGYIFKAFWPNLLVALMSFLGNVGLVIMLIKKKFSHPVLIILILPLIYNILSHLLIHMAPYYLLPTAFIQLIGFSYLIDTVNTLISVKRKSYTVTP
ncbi:glycosyltransferase family 39 protein [Rhodocytophaga rosea]|uniref:Glycosyltransferase family 39 protein n=1 Tax=Rhodocytophaga rosea TaxID=2704465 RepID=A0A6C0GE22_9BACT|nr:glycosyltransferase family 39 protein [Rhodocytophaga rosea]QHT66074.1 glycosyltransferase family 39 protein [Rhodocytophaga rosea]